MQGAANGIVGKACAAGLFELLLQERHGPVDCEIAKLIGWHGNRISQECLGLAGPTRRATRTQSIAQTGWISAGGVAGEPVIHALSADLQQTGDLGHTGAAPPHEQGEGAPVEPDIIGLGQLVFELLHLCGREPFTAHDRILLRRGYHQPSSCQIIFADLLSGPRADAALGAIEVDRLEAREPAGVRLGGGGDAI